MLYTTSFEDIIESISNICGCSEKAIHNFLKQSRPYRNTAESDINIHRFFRSLGIEFTGNNELFEVIKFDSCVVSHLTTRINPPNESDIYCLIDTLVKPTDISKFLASKSITFKKEKQGLNVYYNGELVDWNNFNCSSSYRARKRLRTQGKYIDNCINGFLFNHLFWEDSNVEHIKYCPEIVIDICDELKRRDIISEWEKISTTYALGFIMDVGDITFDEYTRFKTTKSKIYLIYKFIVYFLVQIYHNEWSARLDNPIIRLKDNKSVSKENIFGYYKIDR